MSAAPRIDERKDGESTTAELVPAVSIPNLVAKRNGAVEQIRAAHKALRIANDLNRTFFGSEDLWEGWAIHLFNDRHGGHDFLEDDGVERLVKNMDAHYWNALLDRSGLRTFMDAETRDRWQKNISEGAVPELTEENIEATFAALYAARGRMFEDGVVNFFKNLSWDYRTNNPVKLGKRIVLTQAVSVMGRAGANRWFSGLEYGAGNKLDDLIRVFSVVDGKPEPDHRYGSRNLLNAAGWMKGDLSVDVTELRYLTIRGFKNGNAHVTFLRSDLVDALNKIIAKRFPRALPPTRENA